MILSKFERYKLTFAPTPIEKLSRLNAHLGGDVEIYAKREDCNSGLAGSGRPKTSSATGRRCRTGIPITRTNSPNSSPWKRHFGAEPQRRFE
jgi:hypothetical protein